VRALQAQRHRALSDLRRPDGERRPRAVRGSAAPTARSGTAGQPGDPGNQRPTSPRPAERSPAEQPSRSEMRQRQRRHLGGTFVAFSVRTLMPESRCMADTWTEQPFIR